MGTYAIDSDSPRWWWPSAVAGAVGSAAIAAILVLPADASRAPGVTTPEAPAPPPVTWSSIDPTSARPCFAVRAPRGAVPEHAPQCGQRSVVTPWSGDVRRPGLDVRP
ncbi:MAG TPA: hypothetical protein VLK03_15005 [Nocardioides sp.]|nr:hypothetical protein [Nocardioides sp.]